RGGSGSRDRRDHAYRSRRKRPWPAALATGLEAGLAVGRSTSRTPLAGWPPRTLPAAAATVIPAAVASPSAFTSATSARRCPCSHHQVRKPATNASPAPIVSTTSTSGTAIERSPAAVWIHTGVGPSVTSTAAG